MYLPMSPCAGEPRVSNNVVLVQWDDMDLGYHG